MAAPACVRRGTQDGLPRPHSYRADLSYSSTQPHRAYSSHRIGIMGVRRYLKRGKIRKTSILPPRVLSTLVPVLVWWQMELSLPPVLPQALEEALKPFCTFTQSQWWQESSEGDEAASLNNTTLRRKLLFSHEDLSHTSEPSSPAASPHCGKEGSIDTAGTHETDDSDLVWCTAVIGPGMGDSRQDGSAIIMRHSPPTPSPPVRATTTATPEHRSLPLSCASSNGLLGSLDSADVSPIHCPQYASDLEAVPSSNTSYQGQQHTRLTFTSHNDTPPAPTTCPALHTPPHPDGASEEEWERSPVWKQSQGSQQSQEVFVESLRSGNDMGTQEDEEEEEEMMQSDQKEASTPVNISESFCSQYPDKDSKARSSASSSPSAELRCSSNSGHFSSSPIRDIPHSPLEVDSPARRFSTSPPLSPILCRPFLFPALPSARLHPLLHGTGERKEANDVAMMEESEVFALPASTTTTTLQRCSSLCDMDTDSQPSVESNFGEEAVSQDTGYQTVSSLLTSNISCTTFPQDLPHLLHLQEASGSSGTKYLPSTGTSKEF